MTLFKNMPRTEQRSLMEQRIRTYFEGCNEANVEKMASQFVPEGTHYFPPGIGGPWIGAHVIAENWQNLVMTIGSAWSIERIIMEPETFQAVIEWTHWKTRQNGYLRGDEWYKFDPDTGLIAEIRAFYASASDGRSEVTLEGYDYKAEGYDMSPPVARPHPEADYS